MDVNGQVKHLQNPLVNYRPHEDYSYARTNGGVELINSREMHHNQQQQQQAAAEGSYPSPASTISLHGTHSRDLAMPISTSSELAFALESKPTDQVFVLAFSSITSAPVLIEILLSNRHLEVDKNLIQHMATITIRISSLLVLQLPFCTQMLTVLLTVLLPITTRQISTLNNNIKPMDRSRLKDACTNEKQTALL